MPVLIIVLSAYLFFFAVIALIAIAEYADRRERRHIAERGNSPVVSLAGMSAAQASDPYYFGFWQAQVPGLRLIHDAGHSGLGSTDRTRRNGFLLSEPELRRGRLRCESGARLWLLSRLLSSLQSSLLLRQPVLSGTTRRCVRDSTMGRWFLYLLGHRGAAVVICALTSEA